MDMQMHEYQVFWRDGEYVTMQGYRMEGWSNDYAFFADPDQKYPTDLIPRELVRMVVKVDRHYPEAGVANPYADDTENRHTGSAVKLL